MHQLTGCYGQPSERPCKSTVRAADVTTLSPALRRRRTGGTNEVALAQSRPCTLDIKTTRFHGLLSPTQNPRRARCLADALCEAVWSAGTADGSMYSLGSVAAIPMQVG